MEPSTVSAQKVEQMKKMVCTHQAALDFDRSFCSAATAVEFDENREKNNFSKRRERNLFKKILSSEAYT